MRRYYTFFVPLTNGNSNGRNFIAFPLLLPLPHDYWPCPREDLLVQGQRSLQPSLRSPNLAPRKEGGGKGQSWLYVAVKHGANLAHLASGERLYVGSQTLDRMFRADVARGIHNFHHREMRSGCGDDNLESFLAAGGQADILIASADALREIFEHNPALVAIMPALTALTARGKHLAHWIEQHVLMVEAGQWRWNKAGPESMAVRFFCGES